MNNLHVMKGRDSSDQDLGPRGVARPYSGITGGRLPGRAMRFPLLVQHLLQVGAILHELEGLEIASATPHLFERIDMPDGEVVGLAAHDARRQLLLVSD